LEEPAKSLAKASLSGEIAMNKTIVALSSLVLAVSVARQGRAQQSPGFPPPADDAPFNGVQPAPPPPPPMTMSALDERPQTLLSEPIVHGAYGGPTLAYTRLQGHDAILVGGRGGWLINHRLVVGGAGYGVTNRVAVPAGATASDADHQLTFGYGGFWLEYIVAPSRLVHGSVGALVGGGGLTYKRFRRAENHNDETATDSVLVVEPTVSAEVNLTTFTRLSLFVGYRAVSDVDLAGLSAADVRGVTAGAILKFGMF
jgi:hypothetical protein